jgi:hypothetical protein
VRRPTSPACPTGGRHHDQGRAKEGAYQSFERGRSADVSCASHWTVGVADVPISVGWQSGSHYSTIQALEAYLPAEEINLSFEGGLLFRRMELLIDRQVQAAALFSGPNYFPSSSASAKSSTRPS